MKLWVDVEDIFNYALHVKRPSGIQRVAFELLRALDELAPDSVQLIRHGKQPGSFVTLPFASLQALFDSLADAGTATAQDAGHDAAVPSRLPAAAPAANQPPLSLYRRLRRRCLAALPQPLHNPAKQLWSALAATVRAAGALLKAIFCLGTWRKPQAAWSCAPEHTALDTPAPENTAAVAKGDWLIALGSPWSCPDYAVRVANSCAQHGLRFALLVYDIIPLRRPEWVDARNRLAFLDWFRTTVPLADAVFAISRATAADVERYSRETRLALRTRVQPIPLGTGFRRKAAAVRTRRLPVRRGFALIVSTIEARKNHLLLFRIWRELTEVMPFEDIPQLVFAGRVGWMVQDLMQQLENTAWLNGKIMLIDSPTDGELACLYEDCLFTLYPSFYEGWGLPVSESLSYGAPCLASGRTALPEAGGALARYFDPDNLAEAVHMVRELIEDPEDLEAWRARVAREFAPRRWTDSAQAMIGHLQKMDAMKTPQRRAATIAGAN
jgi:glycosyltransferase involved in cell wall biosynthesis